MKVGGLILIALCCSSMSAMYVEPESAIGVYAIVNNDSNMLINMCARGLQDGGELTPLFVAVRLRDISAARTLIACGADVCKSSRPTKEILYDDQGILLGVYMWHQGQKRLPMCEALRMGNSAMIKLLWSFYNKENLDIIEEATGKTVRDCCHENAELLKYSITYSSRQ